VKNKLEEPGNDKRNTLFRAIVFGKWKNERDSKKNKEIVLEPLKKKKKVDNSSKEKKKVEEEALKNMITYNLYGFVWSLKDLIWHENDIFAFDSAVRLNALKLKNSTNFIRCRKLDMIWSFRILKDKKRCKIPFICEDGMTVVWNFENSAKFCK
ncbi:hypothetical protein Tco_0957206, partial [Tanacetum coccineum]